MDALALVSHLAARGEVGDALASYERDRRPMVDEIQRRGQEDGVAGTQGWLGAEMLMQLAIRLSRFAPASRRRAEVRFMSGLTGEGVGLRAAGVRQQPPWDRQRAGA